MWMVYLSTYAYPLYSISGLRQIRYTTHPTYCNIGPTKAVLFSIIRGLR